MYWHRVNGLGGELKILKRSKSYSRWYFDVSNLQVYTLFLIIRATKMTPKTHIGLPWHFLPTKTPERWIIFYALPSTELCALLQNNFLQFLKLLWSFLPFTTKNDAPSPIPKTYIGMYLHFPQQKTPGRWIILMHFQSQNLVCSFPMMFGQ